MKTLILTSIFALAYLTCTSSAFAMGRQQYFEKGVAVLTVSRLTLVKSLDQKISFQAEVRNAAAKEPLPGYFTLSLVNSYARSSTATLVDGGAHHIPRAGQTMITPVITANESVLSCNGDKAAVKVNVTRHQSISETIASQIFEFPCENGVVKITECPFIENDYLAIHADVADAVLAGTYTSGFHHYDIYGRNEGRQTAAGCTADANAPAILQPPSNVSSLTE